MGAIWDSLIVRPIAQILLMLYAAFGSYGLAIILFTFSTKLILLPFSMKGKRGMMQQQRLQPRAKALENQYKNNRQKYQEELQKLYEREGVSPMSGCLWTLLPWPIFIALYNAIRMPLTNMMGLVEDQIQRIVELPFITSALQARGIEIDKVVSANQIPLTQIVAEQFDAVKNALPDLTGLIHIDFTFLGMDLSRTPSMRELNPVIILPIVAALFSLGSAYISQKTAGVKLEGSAGTTNATMLLMSPIMTIWIGFMWPAAMSLYWVANSVFGIVQDLILGKHYRKLFDRLDEERAEKEAARKLLEKERKAELAKRHAENPVPKKTAKKYKQKNLGKPENMSAEHTDAPPSSANGDSSGEE